MIENHENHHVTSINNLKIYFLFTWFFDETRFSSHFSFVSRCVAIVSLLWLLFFRLLLLHHHRLLSTTFPFFLALVFISFFVVVGCAVSPFMVQMFAWDGCLVGVCYLRLLILFSRIICRKFYAWKQITRRALCKQKLNNQPKM